VQPPSYSCTAAVRPCACRRNSASRGARCGSGKVGDKVILEPISKQPIDFDKFWAELDALGARDFLPDGIPDDPPVEPDPRVFFDE